MPAPSHHYGALPRLYGRRAISPPVGTSGYAPRCGGSTHTAHSHGERLSSVVFGGGRESPTSTFQRGPSVWLRCAGRGRASVRTQEKSRRVQVVGYGGLLDRAPTQGEGPTTSMGRPLHHAPHRTPRTPARQARPLPLAQGFQPSLASRPARWQGPLRDTRCSTPLVRRPAGIQRCGHACLDAITPRKVVERGAAVEHRRCRYLPVPWPPALSLRGPRLTPNGASRGMRPTKSPPRGPPWAARPSPPLRLLGSTRRPRMCTSNPRAFGRVMRCCRASAFVENGNTHIPSLPPPRRRAGRPRQSGRAVV
jgi:hypothetical protein